MGLTIGRAAADEDIGDTAKWRPLLDNPAGDERVPSTFLVLTNLRGGGGFPRQAQLGIRYTF